MRDVLAVGFADNFTVDPRVPIAGIHVENSRAFDGASIARVSFDLAQPIRPRVRSSRNVIYVEADRLDRAAAGVIGAAGPASVIRDLRVERRGASTAITLQATGRLVTTNEVVDASIFLLENGAVNGVNLEVDGGWMLK